MISSYPKVHQLGHRNIAELLFDPVLVQEKIDGCVTGETKIEGIVLKNYLRFDRAGKALMGKYVSEKFKEQAKQTWSTTSRSDIIEQIATNLRTEARWYKAVQHLREQGELLDEPRDIGPLLKELSKDIEEECQDDIKDQLYKWARKSVLKKSMSGFPEWYKKKLANKQFED